MAAARASGGRLLKGSLAHIIYGKKGRGEEASDDAAAVEVD